MKGEALFATGGNVLYRFENVLIQVRRGFFTLDVLQRIEAPVVHLARTAKGPVGFIAVIEEEARMVDKHLRGLQRALIGRMLDMTEARLAVVIPGDDTVAWAQRAIARTIVLGRGGRIHIVSSPVEASSVIGAHTGVSPAALAAAISDARSLASREDD